MSERPSNELEPYFANESIDWQEIYSILFCNTGRILPIRYKNSDAGINAEFFVSLKRFSSHYELLVQGFDDPLYEREFVDLCPDLESVQPGIYKLSFSTE